MVEYKKDFPSGRWVFRAWDTRKETVDNPLLKSIVSGYTDKGLEAGVVCASFHNGQIVAFTLMNTREDYERDMALSIKLEHYEVAYFVRKFWDSRQKEVADAEKDTGFLEK